MKGMGSNKVKEVRCAQGITQEKLADAVGVSRQTIISLEKGNYVPSVLLAIRIARFFKTSVENLFNIN